MGPSLSDRSARKASWIAYASSAVFGARFAARGAKRSRRWCASKRRVAASRAAVVTFLRFGMALILEYARPMPLSHKINGAARVLAPKGRLDHDNCEAFQADLRPHAEACAKEGTALVLDLSGLEYVSSAGLRCLMIARRWAKARAGRIVVAAMQPVVAEIFHISRFNLVLEVFPTLRDALVSVSPQAVAAFERG